MGMNALLNVGLDSPKGEIHPNHAIRSMQSAGMMPRRAKLLKGKTGEMTLVVLVQTSPGMVAKLAGYLRQEAIAVYDLDRVEGMMVGPQAGKWKFDSQLFSVL
jgi:hypothetical protein